MGLTQKIWGQIGSWSSSVLQVASGGTGAATLADGGIVIGNGTSAVEVVTPGATTEILVGGGAATKPVWTTATGSGAPVRAISPTLVTPTIGVATATSVNGLSLTANSTGFSVAGGTTSKSLTVELDSVVNQDLSTDANPTFGNLTITSMAGNWTNAGRTVADGGTVTTIDINGGAIDGTTIGANSAAAITCTTLNTGGKLTAGANEIECSNVDITGGSITGITDLAVADGGTGASTLTDHGILLGSGTGAITPLGVATNGQLPIGSTGADPVLAALTEGEAIDITNGAGTITIACEDASTTNKGVAELATNAEALAGTDTSRIVTPDDLKYVLDIRIQQYYGVSWDESADTYVRTGSTAGQTCGVTLADAFLPIQRRMRRCILNDDGTVNYYLSATDSTKKEDGVTAAVLDGTDGQVMVEIPKFWYRYGYSGTTHTWEISPVPLAGFEVHPAFMSDTTELDYAYVGAYEACLYDVSASKYVGQCHQTSVSAVFATSDDSITIATRTGWANALKVGQKLVVSGTTNNNGTVTVKSIESATKITVDENLTDETAATTVIQTQTDTTNDKLASVSGVCPITGGSANGTRAHFRAWAAKRGAGWSQMMIDVHSAIQLLYLTEYASFYSQSVLGYGIAAVEDWPAYNDYNPIAKTGNSNVVGNASGNTATAAITTGVGAQSVYLSYRGLENYYGHIWKWVDGFNVNNNIPYLCNNPANFADDTASNYTRPKDANGADITMHNADGYQGTLELNGRAFMPASLTGGSASAKITDYYYQSAGWRVAISGGNTNNGVYDGCFFLHCSNTSDFVHRAISGRLVFRK